MSPRALRLAPLYAAPTALAALVAALAALADPPAARACSPVAICREPHLLPADGATIPANATELVVLLGDASIDGAFAPRVRSGGGVEVALVVEDAAILGPGVVRLRLRDPLIEGMEYRVDGLPSSTFCGPTSAVSSRFFVGPAAPLPSGAGAVQLGQQSVREVPSGCGDTIDESFAELRYVADDSFAPWRPLAIVQVIADGEPQGLFRPLDAPLEIAADCDGDVATARSVSLAVVVAGALRDDTAPREVDLSCAAFEGCAVISVRRPRRATPSSLAMLSGTALLALASARRRLRHRRAAHRRDVAAAGRALTSPTRQARREDPP